MMNTESANTPTVTSEQQSRDARFAMRLSLFIGILMLAGKLAAYLLTGSAAIFSDAAEVPSEVTTHLESLEDHSEVHRVQHYTGRPDSQKLASSASIAR